MIDDFDYFILQGVDATKKVVEFDGNFRTLVEEGEGTRYLYREDAEHDRADQDGAFEIKQVSEPQSRNLYDEDFFYKNGTNPE